MYIRHYTKAFKRSVRKLEKSGNFDRTKVEIVVTTLARGEVLAQIYRDHALTGEHRGFRECHIKPDFLLIYKIEKDVLILLLADIGSHSQLFG
jgi:mRNA interferase YafQ